MKWMKQVVFLVATSCVAACSIADTPAQSFSIGKLRVTESGDHLLISSIDGSKVSVRVEPGGVLWPPLVIEDTGRVNVGRFLLDAKSGRVFANSSKGEQDFLNLGHGVSVQLKKGSVNVRREGKLCTIAISKFGFEGAAPPADLIKNSDLLLATSDTDMLVLTRKTVEAAEGRRMEYAVKKIVMSRCAVDLLEDLGDPDYLVEMDWSKRGGWWITGSKEQTLLRSGDGKKWTQVPMHEDISSLFSAYIVDANEIWVAAMMAGAKGSEPFELAYTLDNGASWIGVHPGDPATAKIPRFWLEGARRTATSK